MDHKELSIEELAYIVNRELSSDKSLEKIAQEIFNVKNESTIRKYLNKNGYKRVGKEFIPIDTDKKEVKKDIKDNFPKSAKEHINLVYEENKTENLQSNTDNHTINMTSTEIIVPNTDNKMIFPKGGEEIIIDLIKNYDKIKKVINAYEKGNFSNHTQHEDSNNIVIELPFDDEQLRVTSRVNSKIWKIFGDFCDRNSSYKKMDLFSMALLEYVQKYSKK